MVINIVDGGGRRACQIDQSALYAIESYDGSAIIVSERGYIEKRKLDICEAGEVMHVSSIPSGVGFLSDINLRKNIYIALDFVISHPLRYLATVARLGGTRNLVSLDGTYIKGVKISRLRNSAFPSSGEAGASTISWDGRYVAPNGAIDCSESAYPGVWDVLANKKVVVESQTCAALFAPN